MPKPLELVVYERIGNGLDIDEWCDGLYRNPATGEQFTMCYMSAKRLTDPELAAEHQRAVLDVYRAKVEDKDRETALARMMTVIRFATQPNYDEESE